MWSSWNNGIPTKWMYVLKSGEAVENEGKLFAERLLGKFDLASVEP